MSSITTPAVRSSSTLSPISAPHSRTASPTPPRLRPSSINVLLERRVRTGATAEATESILLFPEESITDLKLRLEASQSFTGSSGTSMAFGDRSFIQSAPVEPDSPPGANVSFNHYYFDLDHVESVQLRTATPKNLSFSRRRSIEDETSQSALTTSLVKAGALSLVGRRSLSWLDGLEPGSGSSNAVVHLVVKRDAHFKWSHSGDNRLEVTVSASDTAESVLSRLEAVEGVAADSHSLIYNGQILSALKPLCSYGVQAGSVLELAPLEPEGGSDTLPDGSPSLNSPAHALFEDWMKARAGLASGALPVLSHAGTGGSYFIRDQDGNNVAVFKPQDEEPCASNNPKGYKTSLDGSPDGLRKGIRPGEGAVREVAAFLLDHGHFAGVPPTALVDLRCRPKDDGNTSIGEVLPSDSATFEGVVRNGVVGAGVGVGEFETGVKVGSLQQWVPSDSDCEERGPSAFPVHEVHKIAVLDIRLANTDRNGGNILARRDGDSWVLIPIDHGATLPSSLEDVTFEWMYYPQAKKPFDERTRAYIATLDADKDLQTLAAHNLHLRPDCARVLKVSTMLLKKAVERGLTPYDIGCIMCREAMTKSPLEKLHVRAMELASAELGLHGRSGVGVGDDVYMKHMAALLDEVLAGDE